MLSEKENVGSVGEINGRDLTGGAKPDVSIVGGKLLPEARAVWASAVDRFYEKLSKLNESSGLSLLFNFRQTSLDLYKFYEEVIVRGGYHQVTKEKRWGEVASSMNPEGSPLLPDQLQKIYGNLLCPFEQIHHYRTSAKDPAKEGFTSGNTVSIGDCLSCLRRKRKRCNSSPVSFICYSGEQLTSAKRKRNANKSNKSLMGDRSINEKLTGATSVKDEDIEFELEAPVRPRSAYQLFLKKECERLKETHGEGPENTTTREMAIEAWRKLPIEKRKPYDEESKKDKERFDREMKTYNDEKNSPVPKPRKRPSYKEDSKKPVVSCSKMIWPISEGDYHVTVQPAPENIHVPNESDIELAIQMMKNQPVNDTVFQINLEEFWSIDLPG